MEIKELEIAASPSRVLLGPIARIVLAALWLGLALSDGPIRIGYLVLGTFWLLLGLSSLRAALESVGGVVLRIGPDGISRGEGSPQTWDGVVMVWVGYVQRRLGPLRRLQSPRIRVYTRSGVAFARRADTDVRASATYVVPTSVPVADLCVALRTFTIVPVIDGDETARWQAERALERG